MVIKEKITDEVVYTTSRISEKYVQNLRPESSRRVEKSKCGREENTNLIYIVWIRLN
jgi:hypothetical protein